MLRGKGKCTSIRWFMEGEQVSNGKRDESDNESASAMQCACVTATFDTKHVVEIKLAAQR